MKEEAITICPVDEMGRNSVIPSTIAMTMASTLVMPAIYFSS
jgi:hypothetical protein